MKLSIPLLVFAAYALTNCVTVTKPSKKDISISQIKERLRLTRNIQDLGFDEKPFNACDLGLKNEDCGDEYLTIIHFQLLCRDSDGTVSTAPALIPIHSDVIHWKLGDTSGITETDEQGFGKVEVRRSSSSMGSRLRLSIEDRFVAVPASETTRLVVPRDWCPH